MTREEFLEILPNLSKGYYPSPGVLSKIGNLTLLMVVGPTGVGKSTLIERSGFAFVPSDTTREPRPGEKQGIDMHFTKDYGQVVSDIKAGRFVQIAVGASGDLYATSEDSYPDSGVAIMPIMADVVPVFRKLGFKKTITVFIAPPSEQEWMNRIRKPGLSEKDIHDRLPEAIRSFQFALSDKQTHFILNENIEAALKQLKGIVDGKTDENRELQARRAAEAILNRLNST